ncbi:hypothetical protein GA830_08225 [Mesorhizobium sp. NBSH29]|uniref:hypothetical protein n=1 Tax=Mesorhizobium sp. NBSH29 TaxID=2654249 RepID=UPI001896A031|nr:hypothetical protein [Mesorhizobium sp. NBSH29]QPC86723.1 hypothetical protein GA830_08225 [Mesorhizobium sp. NBSH29]
MSVSQIKTLSLACTLAMAFAGTAGAQDLPIIHDKAWAAEKCQRYRAAWDELMARDGQQGLTADFLASHDRFMATGCIARADVCPSTDREMELANQLSIAAMNAGTASTFLPFACRD